ncbi:MAG: hypothetical protein H6666_12820 [Ardenticatenaceae bacterium]|nr:hypothetical protein [Ardenticatenaceae bacterium]
MSRRLPHYLWPLLAICLLLAAWLLAAPPPAGAHGGGKPQLVNSPAGPYLVSVWTNPDPLRVGTVHFTVAVSEPPPPGAENGEIVLNAAVRVALTPQNQPPEVRPVGGLATHQGATNKLFYETDLEVPVEGAWQVAVLIDGPVGAGEAAFEIEVRPAGGSSWPILGGVAVVLVVAALLIQVSQKRARPGHTAKHPKAA